MTTRKQSALPLGLLLIALGSLPLLATDESEESEAFAAEVVAGPQYYADTDNRDSAKFEEFRDVPNGFVIERLLLSWAPSPDGFFRLEAIDVTQDDQRVSAEFGKVDVWRGAIRWAENPRRWTDQAFMLHSNNSGALFTLEDSFQSAVRAATTSSLPAGDADLDGQWDPGTKGFLIKNAILDSASPVALRHQRRQGGVQLEFTPTRHWTFHVAAGRELRDGTAPQNLGMYFSLAPAEVAAPLDFRTDTAAAGAEYVSRRFSVGFELQASDFDTGNDALVWDNQLFLIDEAVNANTANPAQGRMTLATSNEMERVSLHGSVNLPAHTRVDASFARSETTQDDAFLPMTINSLLVPAALPGGSYDGEHLTEHASLRATSRPTRSLRWNAWWRSHEIDNRSPSLPFMDYVITDYQFPLCGNVNLACDANGNDVLDDRIQRRSLPYGFKREATGAQLGWRPVNWFDGSLAYEREEVERKFSAVEDSSEDSYKLTLDFEAASWLAVRTTARRQERRADAYNAHYIEDAFPIGEPYVAGFNEGARRFYWTDRDRDSWVVFLDATLDEHWALYTESTYYNDDYFDPETGRPIGSSFTVMEDRNFDTVLETYDILLAGRTESKGDSHSLGVSYSARPQFDVYADYTMEGSEYALASRYRGVTGGVGTDDPLDNWTSSADDDYDTANVGFHWTLDEGRTWTLQGDASWSKGTSLIRTDFVPGGQASGDTTLTRFPEVDATLKMTRLTLERAARKKLHYGLRYWYESWEENNFASDFNGPYMGDPTADPSMAHAVFLGVDFRNYTNQIVSLLMRYDF